MAFGDWTTQRWKLKALWNWCAEPKATRCPPYNGSKTARRFWWAGEGSNIKSKIPLRPSHQLPSKYESSSGFTRCIATCSRKRSMLVIPRVRPEDSGKYECRGTGVQTGHVAITSAQVIVVNSKPDNSKYPVHTYKITLICICKNNQYSHILIVLRAIKSKEKSQLKREPGTSETRYDF